MLLPKLLHCRNKILLELVNSAKQQYKNSRKPSTIQRCVELMHKLNVTSDAIFPPIPVFPPGFNPKTIFIADLLKFPKESTSSNEYVQHFNEIVAPLRNEWEFVYTDGSKTDTSTSFAVTNQLGVTISVGALPSYCSVFTAEAAALLEAVVYASDKGGKFIICSDSKSVMDALLNHSNETPIITEIRNIILSNKNSIRIMWVPGHAGIQGNECADTRAKEAAQEPLHFSAHFTIKDIRKIILKSLQDTHNSQWINYQHHYKKYNPTGIKPIYPTHMSSQNLKIFTRLRIGHTIATHVHILNGTVKPDCPFCNSDDYTTTHLLDTCPGLEYIRNAIHPNFELSNLLNNTDDNSINLICKFIKLTKLKL